MMWQIFKDFFNPSYLYDFWKILLDHKLSLQVRNFCCKFLSVEMLIILRKNLTLKLLNNYYCIHFLSGGNQYLIYCNSPKTICDPRRLVFLHLLIVMIVTT